MAETTQTTQQQQAAQQALTRQRKDLGAVIQGEEFKAALAQMLPKHCTADRFARVLITATMRTPDLLKCSRESFFKCCFDLSALGLEPDGRRAHLIPRRNSKMCACGHWKDAHRGQQCSKCPCGAISDMVECTLIVDYKGLVELVRRSGEVSYIHADVVYEGDEWDFCYGTDSFLRHKPNFDKRTNKVLAVYSFVKLVDGSQDFMVISVADVEAARKVSAAPDSPAWKQWWGEMAKKVGFRRHSKWLPFSNELRDKIEKDDDYSNLDTGAGELPGKVTLSLDAFRPSEDEHRPHDESMDGADGGDRQEQPQGTQREESKSELKPEPTRGAPVPPKRYAKGEMPSADELRLGLECYHDGGHFRVVADGDFQKWVLLGEAPAEQQEGASEATATTASGRGRRKPAGDKPKNPADAFDFK